MRALPLLMLATLTLAASPAAAQTNYDFGSVVNRADFDYTPWAVAATVSPCALDADGDGAYDPGEPIYLDVDSALCDGIEVNDVRLTPSGEKTAGTIVASTDHELGFALVGPLNDDLRYFDADGNAEFGSKDTLYLDIRNAAALAADPGDLRLTKFGTLPAGSVVTSSDADSSEGLREMGSTPRDLMDANLVYLAGGSAPFRDGRTVYINVDAGVIGTADFVVESSDVRLTSTTADPFGIKAKDVKVLGAGFSPGRPVAGRAFQVTVDVKNEGKGPGMNFVATTFHGVVVDARATPLLKAGESAVLVMTLVAPSEAGVYTLKVGDVNYAVNVDAAPDGGATAAEVDALRAQIDALTARLDALEGAGAEASAAAGSGVATASSERADAPGLDVVALLGVVAAAFVLARRRGA